MRIARGIAVCSLVGALVIVSAGSGCQQNVTGTSTASTPEESFESVLATFRRGIETGSGGVVAGSGGMAHKDGGYTSYSIDNRVSHEYFPPKKEGDVPRAIVTIASESRVSVQPGQPAEGRGEREEKTARRDEPSGLDVDILDPATISTSGGSSRPADRGFAPRVPGPRLDAHSRSYELEYRNGRWQLVTKIDPETDKSALDAFEYALKTQL
jgi:hypothetical protein